MYKLHIDFLLSPKIVILLVLSVISMFVGFYLLSGMYLDKSILFLYKDDYYFSYLENAGNLIEASSIILVVIINIFFYSKENDEYRVILITDVKSKTKYVISKIRFIITLIIIMISIYYLGFLFVLRLTPYFKLDSLLINFYLSLVVVCTVYSLICEVLIYLVNTEFISLVVILTYVIAKLLVVWQYYRYLSLLFPVIINCELYYSYLYYLVLIIFLYFLAIFTYLYSI